MTAVSFIALLMLAVGLVLFVLGAADLMKRTREMESMGKKS